MGPVYATRLYTEAKCILQKINAMSEKLVNLVELEALLLDEPTQSQQLAARKATLDKLMHAVQGITKQNVAQVTVSVKTIHDRLLALRNVPSLLESQVDGGTRSQSRTSEELASLAEAYIDGECTKIGSELEKLKKVKSS
ncbi:hypothetical protein Y032_0439g1492 [Ancylostoma ceylanicum]|uniref:Uncharacterized protein n=1 Tax=Ancylostoma ceylanicum TaxID=53326 RepID=A0A016WZ53_9BILA|nr:hypothetical protein Y032_0439g1492 [Ancylostoma ceylanicum]